jgi:hypothetical protein
MATVIQLVPGEKVADPMGAEHTFVAQTPHPLYPSLQLVIWRMADGSWSHDALSPAQDVGQVLPSDPSLRVANLRKAFGVGR